MEIELTGTLQTLKDIQGIQGSFLIGTTEGQLLARDLPRLIDDNALAQVGPRICRLFDVVESEVPTDYAALRFADHRLDVRRLETVHLCVLADANVNLPALRMAMKLVCRKLEQHDFSAAVREPPPEEAKPVTTGSKSGPHGIWRGHRY